MKDRISELSQKNRKSPSLLIEQELVELRILQGKSLREKRSGAARHRPVSPDLFTNVTGLPDIRSKNFSSSELAAAVLSHGGLVVRGLYSMEQVERLQSLAEQEEDSNRGGTGPLGCTPHSLFELLDIYKECGLLEAVTEYLDGEPLMFGERAKLRCHRAGRDKNAAIPWHQDVNFFGRMSFGINCWAAVTHCGRDNPGLEIIPCRTEQRLGWEEANGIAPLNYGRDIPLEQFTELTRRYPPVNVVLEPGDAVFFDEMTLHKTALRRWQLREQIVTISWFFSASGFPDWGTPLAV